VAFLTLQDQQYAPRDCPRWNLSRALRVVDVKDRWPKTTLVTSKDGHYDTKHDNNTLDGKKTFAMMTRGKHIVSDDNSTI
jgi:hypothetical protein